ncbi:hypothetical protein DsansV1_C21g0166941 [Dioscorea sansibarensis]
MTPASAREARRRCRKDEETTTKLECWLAGQDQVKKQKQEMESQVDKTTIDVKRIAELNEGQMQGKDNANNRRMMHKHVEGSVLKNGISEAVATEGRLSDCHMDGDRQRFVTHSTVEMEPGRERRERRANPRYRDYLWSLNRERERRGKEGGGENQI